MCLLFTSAFFVLVNFCCLIACYVTFKLSSGRWSPPRPWFWKISAGQLYRMPLLRKLGVAGHRPVLGSGKFLLVNCIGCPIEKARSCRAPPRPWFWKISVH